MLLKTTLSIEDKGKRFLRVPLESGEDEWCKAVALLHKHASKLALTKPLILIARILQQRMLQTWVAFV